MALQLSPRSRPNPNGAADVSPGSLSFHAAYRPDGSFEEYLSHVEKKQRHEIRRKMRRALESEIPVRFYIVEQAGTLDSEIEAFFQLMENDANKSNF